MGLLTSVNNLSYTLEEEKKNKKIEQIKKQNEKIHNKNLSLALQEFFYKEFKKSDDINYTYINFINIQEREHTIYLISNKMENKSEFDIRYINSIYEKELQKIYKIFKNNKTENIKYFKSELEKHIKKEFQKYFNIAGSSYVLEFYNKNRKQEILNNFFDEYDYLINDIKEELEEHFYNKYDKILNSCLKEQKQQEIYNTTVEAKKIEVIEEEEKKNNNILPIFLAVLLTICKIGLFIVFAPIILILMILFAAIKAM